MILLEDDLPGPSLAHWTSKLSKLLAQKENLLVLDYWTELVSSPGIP